MGSKVSQNKILTSIRQNDSRNNYRQIFLPSLQINITWGNNSLTIQCWTWGPEYDTALCISRWRTISHKVSLSLFFSHLSAPTLNNLRAAFKEFEVNMGADPLKGLQMSKDGKILRSKKGIELMSLRLK